MRAATAFRFHGGDEVVLDVPASLELGGDLHFVQGNIPHTTDVNCVRPEIVGHRAGVAVYLETVAGSEGVNATELEHALRAVGETTEDGEQIRDNDLVALPDRVDDPPARK